MIFLLKQGILDDENAVIILIQFVVWTIPWGGVLPSTILQFCFNITNIVNRVDRKHTYYSSTVCFKEICSQVM